MNLPKILFVTDFDFRHDYNIGDTVYLNKQLQATSDSSESGAVGIIGDVVGLPTVEYPVLLVRLLEHFPSEEQVQRIVKLLHDPKAFGSSRLDPKQQVLAVG